jgi:arylsulfatase A-like enzyme
MSYRRITQRSVSGRWSTWSRTHALISARSRSSWTDGSTRAAGAIRKGTYKLLEFFETGTVELYDLARDLGERHDLSAAEPAKARELREDLAAWRKRLDAKMPRAK